MKTEMKLDKIEKSGSGVKFAHIDIQFDGETMHGKTIFKVQSSGNFIVLTSNHNIVSIKNFLEILEQDNGNIERKIQEFATELIEADDLINTKKVA